MPICLPLHCPVSFTSAWPFVHNVLYALSTWTLSVFYLLNHDWLQFTQVRRRPWRQRLKEAGSWSWSLRAHGSMCFRIVLGISDNNNHFSSVLWAVWEWDKLRIGLGGTGFALDLRSGSGSVWLPWLAISRPRPPLRVFYIYIIFFFFFGLRTPFCYCFFLLFLLLVIQASWTCVHALPISLAHRHILLTGIQSCVALRYSFLASSPTSTFDIGLNFIEIPTTTTTSAMHRGFPFRFALIAFGHCVEQRDILSHSAPSLPSLPSNFPTRLSPRKAAAVSATSCQAATLSREYFPDRCVLSW